MSEYEDILLDHDYDGITEYDNPMPAWWKWLFVITVIWGFLYIIAINMGYVPTYGEDLHRDSQELAAIKYAYQQSQPKPKITPELLATVVVDPDKIKAGAEVFKANCANCHGPKGQGLIGPNLTDAYWLHGGDDVAVHKVIINGVTANGMPAWGSILTYEESLSATAFLHSIRGTTPPNPKPPQGELYKPKEEDDKAGDKAGDEPGDKAGDKAGDEPGDKAGDEPGAQPGAQPGDKPVDEAPEDGATDEAPPSPDDASPT